MTSPWVLLLTDEPRVAMTTLRLAQSIPVKVGRGAQDPDAVGAGPPALVVIGADRRNDRSLPAEASGVPRLLVAVGEPDEGLWQVALELRAEQIVLLPAAEHILAERFRRLTEASTQHALMIAVAGGCGGAGASVLAAALARSAAAVARTLLIDVDQLGSGADLLLGAEDEPGLRWPDLVSVRGRLSPQSLLGALPVIDGLHVLTGNRSPSPVTLPAEAATAVLDAVRSHYEVIVLDLPRWLDAPARAAAQTADLGLLVVPAQLRAAVASARIVHSLKDLLADVRLVIRGPAPPGLSAEAIADALDLPLIGTLRPEPGLRTALERGEPPGLRARGPLSTFCRDLLAGELAQAHQDRAR
jgi:secretion/DNA translocation related CpaE-like protein